MLNTFNIQKHPRVFKTRTPLAHPRPTTCSEHARAVRAAAAADRTLQQQTMAWSSEGFQENRRH